LREHSRPQPLLKKQVERRMNRTLRRTACGLAVGLATSVFNPARTLADPPANTSLPFRGEMVDTSAPATYRLPAVRIFDPPQNRLALRTSASEQKPTRILPASESQKSAPEQSPSALACPRNKAELTSQLLPAVQRGYNLAQRGAFFAARTEFIQVLRRVAQAKDAGSSTDVHARALAAGLRALDEADDFMPQGVQLEAELDVRTVASSHRTPVLGDYPEEVMPQEAIVMYHTYAQQQLANAAADQQCGSMALYGLGKVYARLAERRDDDVQFTRGAMTMYAAALDACPDNHLAANELGVLLCRMGHPAEAVHQFERTIDRSPNATAYHNLAVAQQKLGMAGQAAANEQESQRLAAMERSNGGISRRAGVQWVSPAELARVSQPTSPTPVVATPDMAARPTAPGNQWR
jgi:tetratricopeptide (TPR) repeat protein